MGYTLEMVLMYSASFRFSLINKFRILLNFTYSDSIQLNVYIYDEMVA